MAILHEFHYIGRKHSWRVEVILKITLILCFPLLIVISSCGQPETAEKAQREAADTLGIPVEITNSVGMKLRLIPVGSFMMGSPASDQEAGDSEFPQHRVTISKSFYMGVTEVTQGQWVAVMGNNHSEFKYGDDYPVETVNWNKARDFCIELSQLTGESYRLPTEAEWEYACRAGTSTRYYWGDSDSEAGEYAWYYAQRTHPVGQLRGNSWGLYDMSGNVSEFCRDVFQEYSSSAQRDPEGPWYGSHRIVRGGGWGSEAKYIRSASRAMRTPISAGRNTGFRVVREVE
jgi:formylglycine-generating enzyme required for sulfatase activity